MSKAEPRVVIRRKKLHHQEAHGGSWKIAYADFMTAMMAFFLVMWLLSLIPVHELTLVAEYFRKPLVEAIRSQNENRPLGTDAVIPGGAPSVIPNFHLTPRSPTESGDISDIERLENLKERLEDLIEHDPVMSEYQPQMLLDMTPDGLRVQIVDRENRPMFATGSARLQREMRVILRQLGPVLNGMPNSITITGHTDAVQYATGEREYSNWELSADRANAARRELVAGGMDETKVRRVQGLSSTVNLVQDPYADANRRISILVLNRGAERRMDNQDASYAAPVDLDEVLGVGGSSKLGVERRMPPSIEEQLGPQTTDPLDAPQSGSVDDAMPESVSRVPPLPDATQTPLIPGASNLVETVVPTPTAVTSTGTGAGTLSNIR